MKKMAPGCLVYIGGYTTQLYRDYFINHEIRIPINQPVFQWKVGPGFLFVALVELDLNHVNRITPLKFHIDTDMFYTVYIFIYAWDPCMIYLPTFTIKINRM